MAGPHSLALAGTFVMSWPIAFIVTQFVTPLAFKLTLRVARLARSSTLAAGIRPGHSLRSAGLNRLVPGKLS